MLSSENCRSQSFITRDHNQTAAHQICKVKPILFKASPKRLTVHFLIPFFKKIFQIVFVHVQITKADNQYVVHSSRLQIHSIDNHFAIYFLTLFASISSAFSAYIHKTVFWSSVNISFHSLTNDFRYLLTIPYSFKPCSKSFCCQTILETAHIRETRVNQLIFLISNSHQVIK